jgi:hypothetical protein
MRMKMKLNKEEQKFIAENITRFDVVTEIEVNDIEVRIHGKHFGGVGSAAIYRTNDMKAIWNHTTDKIKKVEKNLQELAPKRFHPRRKYCEPNQEINR